MKSQQIKNLTLSSILIALSFLITMSPLKLPFPPPFSLTIASHVPTMIACFVNPVVAVLTAVGSALGFLFFGPFGMPMNVVVALRALMHLLFALFIIYAMKMGMKRYVAFSLAGVIHALSEGLVVVVMFRLFPDMFGNTAVTFSYVTYTVMLGTFVHHIVDSLIALPVAEGLSAARLIAPLHRSKDAKRFKESSSAGEAAAVNGEDSAQAE